MKKIRIVQIGTTHPHASGIFKSVKELKDYFEIAGIAEPTESSRKNLKEALYLGTPVYSVEDLLHLPDIDAALIETTESELVKYAQMAIDHGIHVHMDKPGGENFHAFQTMVNCAKTKNLVFHMGYMYRFNPAIQKSIDLVKSGALGRIHSIDVQMCIRLSEQGNRGLKRFKGGMMSFLGCHIVDVVLSLAGIPQEVIPFNYSTGLYCTESLNYGMAVFRYPGCTAVIRSSAADLNGFWRRQIVINGSNGSIEIKPIEAFDPESTDYLSTSMNVTYGDSGNPCFDMSEKLEFPKYKRYDDMMIDFAKIVRGECINSYSYGYEIELQRLILMAGGVQEK